jgi:ribosome biogenesis GTPase
LTADASIGQVFPEIEALAATCRFSDCRHEHEPGCAVADATRRGVLDQARLANFRKLERELAAEARRIDPLERKAAVQMWKARSKAARLHDKRRSR